MFEDFFTTKGVERVEKQPVPDKEYDLNEFDVPEENSLGTINLLIEPTEVNVNEVVETISDYEKYKHLFK